MNDLRYRTPEEYGSTTRYNQLQNYPQNIPDGVDMLNGVGMLPAPFDENRKRDYQERWDIERQIPYDRRWNQATNKYDMTHMINQGRQWQEEDAYKQRLYDLLQSVFGEGYIE